MIVRAPIPTLTNPCAARDDITLKRNRFGMTLTEFRRDPTCRRSSSSFRSPPSYVPIWLTGLGYCRGSQPPKETPRRDSAGAWEVELRRRRDHDETPSTPTIRVRTAAV